MTCHDTAAHSAFTTKSYKGLSDCVTEKPKVREKPKFVGMIFIFTRLHLSERLFCLRVSTVTSAVTEGEMEMEGEG